MTAITIENQLQNKTQTAERLCYLFLLFLAGCIVGWVYKEIYCGIAEGILRNRGILYGPWLPIYGIGTLGIYALKPVKKHLVWLFLLSSAVAGIVGYIIGFAGIHLFGLRLWDYRGLFWNIGGIICLRSVVSFGLLGLAFHYLLEPTADAVYRKAPGRAVHGVCLVTAALFLADCVLSFLFRTPITY